MNEQEFLAAASAATGQDFARALEALVVSFGNGPWSGKSGGDAMTDELDDFENFDDERGVLPQCPFCDHFADFCHMDSVVVADGWCSDWQKFYAFTNEHLARMLGELQNAVDEIRAMLAVAGKTLP